MKSTKRYMNSTILVTIFCTAMPLSAMEPAGYMGESDSSSEHSIKHPVSQKDAKMLNDTIETLKENITILNKIREKKEKEIPYKEKTIANIQQQQRIFRSAIAVAESMRLGENPVDINKINEIIKFLELYPV